MSCSSGFFFCVCFFPFSYFDSGWLIRGLKYPGGWLAGLSCLWLLCQNFVVVSVDQDLRGLLNSQPTNWDDLAANNDVRDATTGGILAALPIHASARKYGARPAHRRLLPTYHHLRTRIKPLAGFGKRGRGLWILWEVLHPDDLKNR